MFHTEKYHPQQRLSQHLGELNMKTIPICVLQKLSMFVFIFLALTHSLLSLRVQAALPKELPTAPEKFLTGACLTRSEDLWITAEAGGVYRLSGQEMKPKWENMRKQPGFPKTDNCTAVCEDSQGRIWVGTSNMGVQVFHKGQWKRYDRDTVLGGSHVHALATTSTGHFLVNFLKIVSWQT